MTCKPNPGTPYHFLLLTRIFSYKTSTHSGPLGIVTLSDDSSNWTECELRGNYKRIESCSQTSGMNDARCGDVTWYSMYVAAVTNRVPLYHMSLCASFIYLQYICDCIVTVQVVQLCTVNESPAIREFNDQFSLGFYWSQFYKFVVSE